MLTTPEIIKIEDQFQIPTYAKMPLAAVSGSGSTILDADGNSYLDFYGGHCVTLLGHCHPGVVSAVQKQAATLLFYSNAVYSPVRAEAAQRLVEYAPEGLHKAFFCNSGTEANETALKLAKKYTGREEIVAMVGDFHGRTMGSLAATWNPKYREPYADSLSRTYFVAFGDLDELEHALAHHPGIGAIIMEPIQSMAGIVTATADYFRDVRRLCIQYGVVLIFDEVQTGVGRTGTFSISEQFEMEPDIITLAKSLGSGVPVGAVLVNDTIANSVELGDQGTTFGGGMLAMAAVCATLKVLGDEDLMSRAVEIFESIERGLTDLDVEVRGAGCLIGIQLPVPAKPVVEKLREQGVLVGSAADPHVIRLMPPLNTSDEEIDLFLGVFTSVLDQELIPEL